MGVIAEKFSKRKEYDDSNPIFEYPDLPSLYTKYFIDTWNVIPYYGKVDTLGIPVIPKDNLVRYCTYGSDSKQVQALQPMTSFFFSLRQEYDKYFKSGNINKNSKYLKKDLMPVKGFTNPSVDYFNKIQDLYSGFIDYLRLNNKFNMIENYDSFLNELLIYIKTRNLYLTRAGFVESYDYSLLYTGLTIDLYDETTSNDDERLNFYNDINYEALLELCIRNNLKIDREIPWRIFLDIRTKSSPDSDKSILSFSNKIPGISPKIEDYIPEFEDKLQLFFDVYYNKVVPCDNNSYAYFSEFVLILQNFYQSFTNSYPIIKKYEVNECGNANVINKNRQILNEDIISYDRSKYANLYLNFRNIELSKVVPEEKLIYHTNVANNIYKETNKKLGFTDAVISSIKYYTYNIGTLAYRNPSLYELDEKQKMP